VLGPDHPYYAAKASAIRQALTDAGQSADGDVKVLVRRAQKKIPDALAVIEQTFADAAKKISEDAIAAERECADSVVDAVARHGLANLQMALVSEREWVSAEKHYESTYGSQGHAAGTYASAYARLRVEVCTFNGVPARMEPVPDQNAYAVLVHGDLLIAKLLRYAPEPSLRDLVRWCWKHGVNPRVYWFWLPAGYEDRVGLDYFGGDRSTKTLTTP